MAYKAKSKLQVCTTLVLCCEVLSGVYTQMSKSTITYASYCCLPQKVGLGAFHQGSSLEGT